MSLKAVELQVALPRTQDISRIQDQHQQKTMHEQLGHIAERTQLDQQQRQRTVELNETNQGHIKEKQERQKRQKNGAMASDERGGSHAAEDSPSGERSLMHDPLRGRHIDISL